MFGDGYDSRMLNGDFVEGFEAVDWSKRFAVLLEHEEPPRTVRGIRGFVCAGFDLLPDNIAHFFLYARWYGDIPLDPGGMRDDGEIDGREEIFAEGPSFFVVPCEACLVVSNKVMH
jgi:hypothetical protein